MWVHGRTFCYKRPALHCYSSLLAPDIQTFLLACTCMCLTCVLFGVADVHNVKLSTCVVKWTRCKLFWSIKSRTSSCHAPIAEGQLHPSITGSSHVQLGTQSALVKQEPWRRTSLRNPHSGESDSDGEGSSAHDHGSALNFEKTLSGMSPSCNASRRSRNNAGTSGNTSCRNPDFGSHSAP